MEKTTSLVNDEKCKQQGRNMLKSAQSELKADLEIVELFSKQPYFKYVPDIVMLGAYTQGIPCKSKRIYGSNGRGAT